MLDIKLDTLLAVYEEKSFTRASEKLNLTQPAISNHIHLLELEIGHPICIRTKKALTFTPEGEIVVNYAKQLKAIYSEMCEEIALKKESPSQLKLGVVRSVENHYAVIDAVGKYIEAHPETRISLNTGTIQSLSDMLENYELDLMIADELPEHPQFLSRILGQDHFVCLISRANPLSDRDSITLEELKQERLITWPSSSSNRILFDKALEQIGESIQNFNIALEISSTSTIKMLAHKDVGVAVVPRSIFSGTGKYRGVPVENLDIIREIYLICRKDFTFPAIIDSFTEFFENFQRLRRL